MACSPLRTRSCPRRSETHSVPRQRLRPPVPVSPALPSWDWKPVDGLSSLPYLQPEPQKNEKLGYLTQAEWWDPFHPTSHFCPYLYISVLLSHK